MTEKLKNKDAQGEKTVGPEVSNSARILAEEKGVDLTEVEGTGKDRKILKGDVEAYLVKNGTGAGEEQAPKPEPEPEFTFDVPGKLNHEPFPKGGKAELTFNAWAREPRKMTFIPLGPHDAPGTLSAIEQFTFNGVRINVVKGVQVEVPAPLADHIAETQEAQRRALLARTKDLIHGGTRSARLDLLSDAQKLGVL